MFDKPIAIRPISNHPDDAYLQVVLHKNFKGEYVTHVQNLHDGDFVFGHYFGKGLDALEEAMADFKSR